MAEVEEGWLVWHRKLYYRVLEGGEGGPGDRYILRDGRDAV